MKSKSIIIPTYIIKYYSKLNISEREIIFLSYLGKYGDKIPFDVELFHNELGYEINLIMEIITGLINKKLITVKIIKNDKGISEEYLDIDNFNNKIANLIVENDEEIIDSNIYSVIEKEFGRVLSPIEFETIKKWLDNKIDEKMILDAVKEAVLCGVFNLKYIDKILYEWSKKGYKKIEDKEEDNIEIFDYNWLDENE